ncbi:PIN domain-containing protein [Nanoarchaeota archaeon]
MIIVLDTNFLIYMIKQRVADQLKDLGGKIIVPSTVKKELQKPSLGIKERAFASAALELLKVWDVEVMQTDVRDVDKSIIDVAERLKTREKAIYVATSDKKLVNKLSSLGIRNICLKGGKVVYLA